MKIESFAEASIRLVCALLVCGLSVVPFAHSKNESAGMPAVLKKLEEIQQKLEQNATEVSTLKTAVASLAANTIPCTLERFRAGLCGPDNHPLDLTVSICGSVGADGSFTTKYSMSGSVGVQVGVGWKDGPDVELVENFQGPPGIPVILPTIPPVPVGWIMLPSEVAANLNAAAALGLDACIDDIRIPIGKSISEPVVIAILEQLEQTAQPVLDTLSAQFSGGGNISLATTRASIDTAGIGLEGLSTALARVTELAQLEFNSTSSDPLDAFRNGPLRDFADTLPVGSRLQDILDNPGKMALPALKDSRESQALTTATTGTALNYTGLASNLCANLSSTGSSLQTVAEPVCNFVTGVGEKVPTLDAVLTLIANINLLPDVPAAVKALLQPLFESAGDVVADVGNQFCDSRVGSRAIFDGLCGR
jgi:hypothetical protein